MKERRAIVRQRSFMKGRILFNHGRASADCIIRDFTRQGARLEISDTAGVPDSFEIHVPSRAQNLQAHVIWRQADAMGVVWATDELFHQAVEGLRSGDPLANRVARLEHDVEALRKRIDALLS